MREFENLITECERANQRAIDEIGMGLIDLNAIARAKAALAASPVPAGWLPIESAPKDSILLLGYLPHPRMEGSRRVYEGRWNKEQGTWTSANGFLVHSDATHYMPLPAAPSAPAQPATEQQAPHGIYTASKTAHAAKWRELRAAGLPIIATWIDEAGVGETSDWADLWRRCVREAANCTALIAYREGGEVLKGALVEIGAALASGRPVYLVGFEAENFSFKRHPLVTVCGSVDEALALVGSASPPQEPQAPAHGASLVQGYGDEDVYEWHMAAKTTAPAPSVEAQADDAPTYTTEPGESLMGMALRQLKDANRWQEIAALNADRFPDQGPHDYYPVGTVLKMPALKEPQQ